MIFRFELLQPSKVIDFIVTFSAANGRCENPGLVLDGIVVQRQPLAQTILRPL